MATVEKTSALEWISQKIDLTEKSDLIAFFESNIWEGKIGSVVYARKYERNPSGSANIWAAKAKRSQKIVSSYVAMPWKFRVLGEEQLAMQCCDVFTSFRFRGLDIYASQDKEAPDYFKGKNVAFFFAFPNANAVAGHQKAGWQKIGRLQRWVKVLKSEHIFKKLIKNKFLSRLTGAIVDFILLLFSKEKWISGTGYETVEIQVCDEKFDQLWRSESSHYGILAVRDAKYLNWRYLQSPKKNKTILAIKQSEKILGYAVLEIEENFGAIVDIFSKKDETVIAVLVAQSLKYFHRNNVATVSYCALEKDFYLSQLSRFGFQMRENSSVLMGTPVDHSDTKTIFTPENWHITLGDCDIESVL